MALNSKTHLDDAQFKAALRAYLPTTKKDLARVINERALNVAFRWQQNIPKADKDKIERELGVSWTPAVNKKGASVRKRSVKPAKFIYGIVNAARSREGKPGLTGAKMEKAAKKVIASRTRAVAFLKSGCIQMIKRLATVTGKSLRPQGKQYGTNKGWAIPAKDSFSPSAEIVNNAIGKTEKSAKALRRYGFLPLQMSLNAEAGEMIQHVRNKLQKTANKFNGRK